MSVCRFIPIELHVKIREYPTDLQKISFFRNLMETPNFFCIFHLTICKSNNAKNYPKFVRVIKKHLNGIIPL